MNAISPLRIVPDTPNPYQPDLLALYLGGFDNHTVDGDHLFCAEKAVKQKRDIEVRVFSLAEIKKGDLAFPTQEAEEMHKRGAALMIVLTPWANTGSQDDLFGNEPQRIILSHQAGAAETRSHAGAVRSIQNHQHTGGAPVGVRGKVGWNDFLVRWKFTFH